MWHYSIPNYHGKHKEIKREKKTTAPQDKEDEETLAAEGNIQMDYHYY
jgi:hypothetical protein